MLHIGLATGHGGNWLDAGVLFQCLDTKVMNGALGSARIMIGMMYYELDLMNGITFNAWPEIWFNDLLTGLEIRAKRYQLTGQAVKSPAASIRRPGSRGSPSMHDVSLRFTKCRLLAT